MRRCPSLTAPPSEDSDGGLAPCGIGSRRRSMNSTTGCRHSVAPLMRPTGLELRVAGHHRRLIARLQLGVRRARQVVTRSVEEEGEGEGPREDRGAEASHVKFGRAQCRRTSRLSRVLAIADSAPSKRWRTQWTPAQPRWWHHPPCTRSSPPMDLAADSSTRPPAGSWPWVMDRGEKRNAMKTEGGDPGS